MTNARYAPPSILRIARRVLAAGRIGICVIALLAAVGCARTPPETALRNTIAALQQNLEARDSGAVHAVFDDDFVGPDGMDRRAARQLATALLLRHRQVGLTPGPLDVQLQGDDRARVRTTVAVTGGSGALLPERAGAYRIDSVWRRRGDDWTLLSLQWEAVGD